MIRKRDLLERIEKLEIIQENRFEDCKKMNEKLNKISEIKGHNFNSTLINILQQFDIRIKMQEEIVTVLCKERVEKALGELFAEEPKKCKKCVKTTTKKCKKCESDAKSTKKTKK